MSHSTKMIIKMCISLVIDAMATEPEVTIGGIAAAPTHSKSVTQSLVDVILEA